MKILVLNSGSSSLKFQLINMPDGIVDIEGIVSRIGIEGGNFVFKFKEKKLKFESNISSHKEAISIVLEKLISKDFGILENINEIKAVGHRIVHGGEYFSESIIINSEVINKIEELESLAPLHNPANKIGILAINEILPGIPQVAVFDTAFHQSMKPENYIYAIDYKYYEKYKIRRYGFHGTSHKYVSNKVCEFLNLDYSKTKIINCHIGNGASICAIDSGKVIETSMGFTPLEGLVMGTRSGDLDPAIITFIAKTENKTFQEIDEILNKNSGVLGITQKYSDMKDLEDAYLAGDERSILAINIYINRIIKYIGSYVALMQGVEIITFTAGVLENSPVIRKLIVDKLGFLGVKLNEEQNNFRGEKRIISTLDSKIKVVVIPTNEELVIATDTFDLLK